MGLRSYFLYKINFFTGLPILNSHSQYPQIGLPAKIS